MDVRIPLGTLLNPMGSAALACRTHLLGRTLDLIISNLHFDLTLLLSPRPSVKASASHGDGLKVWRQPSSVFLRLTRRRDLYQIGFGLSEYFAITFLNTL